MSGERGVRTAAALRFGIRQLTYELSLFDHAGRLRRVEVDPTRGTVLRRSDWSMCATRPSSARRNGWAESLTAAGEHSPAVRRYRRRSR